ncbi:MAG: restriction endonuclease subunit S [Gammaproteobacteria bacterium]|nr:restriction endonuclease subunit S [Gammaproteobacteria bacterium]
MSSLVTLGELVTAASVERAGDRDLPVLSMTRSGGLVPQESVFNKTVASRDLSKYRVVRPSQLVVGIHIDEGALGVSRDDQMGIVSPAYTLWDLPDSELLDPDYLHRYIRSPWAISYFIGNYRQTAERRGKIPRDKFLELPIPLPPLAEQKRIAGILDAADALRARRREALAQLDTLLQSTFLDMFGDPVTNPMGWHRKTLGEIINFVGGSQPPKTTFTYEPSEGTVRLVQIRDFKTDSFKTYIPEELARRRFDSDDVMIARYGPPVFQILRGLSGSYNVALMKAEPIGRIEKLFIFHLLSHPAINNAVVAQSVRTAGQTGVNLQFLNNYPAYLPPLDLQRRFAVIVESIEQQKARQRAHLDELDILFASLQSHAFRGDL